jgi:ribosome-associated toxin RatA of RatAB toxin-antitoxin module
MGQLEFTRRLNAPKSIVWDVITDHGLYAEAAPNLRSVEVIDGAESTMVRRCVDTGGNAWTEACTNWEEGKRFAVEVDVATSDFHRRLFNRFEGQWGLNEMDGELEVFIRFDYDTKYGPFGWFFSAVLAYKAPGLVEGIFDRWEAEIEAHTRAEMNRTGVVTAEPQPTALYP